ncbi:hypothetical protein D9M68_452020 [compost metagenome]
MPKAASSTSAVSATKPPAPMPNWLTASSPNWVLSAATLQPRAPMVKPATARPMAPIAPPASSQRPCALPAGKAAPTAHSSSPASPMKSQLRPCVAACIRPLAPSACPKTCGTASYQVASWIAYQGSTR